MNNKALERAVRIIDALYSRQLPAELRDRIRMWFGNEAHISEKYAALEKIYHEEVNYDENPDQETLDSFADLSAVLGFPQASAETASVRVEKRVLKRSFAARIAAVMIPAMVLLGAGYLAFRPEITGKDRIASVEVPVTAGQNQEVALIDGSRIVVSPGAKIEYPKRQKQGREVYIEQGKVHFNVAKDEGRPFVVRTANVTVTVLGTEFDVFENTEERYTEVTLYSGRIEVEAGGVKRVMERGESMKYDHDAKTTDFDAMPAGEMINRGYKPSLRMNNATLGELIESIEANYNVKFDIPTRAVIKGNYSVDFEGEKLDDVLKYLNVISTGYGFTKEDGKIIMSKK